MDFLTEEVKVGAAAGQRKTGGEGIFWRRFSYDFLLDDSLVGHEGRKVVTHGLKTKRKEEQRIIDGLCGL